MNLPRRSDSCQPTVQLWRQIQTIIRTGQEQDFECLCEKDRAPQVARVLLSQRLVNDSAASTKRRLLPPPIQPQQPFHRIFGTSVRDLNALQISLFLRQESIAIALLDFLHGAASRNELGRFMNHPWGQQNTSLHLAAYLGMDRLVQRLLEYGADPTLRNARQHNALDGCTSLACIQLLQPTTQRSDGGDLARTSMLLKKAVQRVGPMEQLISDYRHHTLHRSTITKPALVFSSSTSSSSYSSLSSLEDPPTTPSFLCRPSHDMYAHALSVAIPPHDKATKPHRQTPKKYVRFSPETLLLDACVNGDVDELRRLTTTTRLDEWEHRLHHQVPSSLLHLALRHGQEEMVRALVTLGADVNATDPEGWTPLHHAAALKLWSMVALLARQPEVLIHARTRTGLAVYECPRTWADQRRCQSLIERARRLGT